MKDEQALLHVPNSHGQSSNVDRRIARATAGVMHGAVILLLFLVSVTVAGSIIGAGLPVLPAALLFAAVFFLLVSRKIAARRDLNRVAVFGDAEFVAAVRAAAAVEGDALCLAVPSPDHVGPALLQFLTAARAHHPGTILVQLPPQATALRQRLPRLLETEPALLLVTTPGAPQARLGQPVMVLAEAPLQLRHALLKRGLDLTIALPALVLLAPLFLLIALAVRLESPGSPIFRQRRIGRLGQSFIIFKFRSMGVEARNDGKATTRDDPRVTRLGRWLRATSIDELPQLLNVALGEMSIVGPRPHVPTHRVEGGIYAEVIADYAARHRVMPGITGLAQINGMRGGIECRERAQRGVALDLRYIREWSFTGDVRIIAQTLLGRMTGRDVF